VSTATNGGILPLRVLREEDGCKPDGEHFNEYTRSKAIAETLIREGWPRVLVIRPSIILSAGIPSFSFAKSILWFLPLLTHFEAVPVNPESRIDVVPISFVVESMIRLLELPQTSHDCYHVSAGTEGSYTCGVMSQFLDRHYGRPEPLKLIEPTEWDVQQHRRWVHTRKQRSYFKRFRPYLPFLNMDVVYENARLKSDLGEYVSQMPRLPDYLGELLDQISIEEMLQEAPAP
jgi:nucleoside-diphosphate-sugar epimerase